MFLADRVFEAQIRVIQFW
jgi:hypothetical protein